MDSQAGRHIPGEAGLWLLIFGEMSFFTALFGAFLRARGADPAGFDLARAALSRTTGIANTLVLLTSSLLVAKAVEAVRSGDTARAPRLFRAGLGCALGFVALKGLEYTSLFSQGVTLGSHPFFGFYFGLTALHLGHVVIGSAFLLLLSRFTRRPLAKPSHFALVESAGVFWHMVDLLWLVIFALLYLVE
mgnify:CR=1 FL=1